MLGYDEKSPEGTLSDLTSVFALPLTDVTVTQVKPIRYFPISSIDKQTKILEFNLNSADSYLDISSLLLNLSGKFVEVLPTGAVKVEENKRLSCVNLLFHALIEKIEIVVNNVEVVNLSHYGLWSYFNVMLNATDNERKTSLQTQMFYPGPVGKSDTLTEALTGGLLTRSNAIKGGKIIH